MSVILALVAINLGAFGPFAWDKRQARRGGWRVPEARFLFLAACGAWPALKLGQRIIRHKTRKQPFGTLLNMMAGVNCLLILMGWLLLTGDFDPSHTSQTILELQHHMRNLLG